MQAEVKEPKRLLILEATGGGGHISITDAIIQALNKNNGNKDNGTKDNGSLQIQRGNLNPPYADQFYRFASRGFPQLWRVVVKMTENKTINHLAATMSYLNTYPAMVALFKRFEPHVILSQSPVATPAISLYLWKHRLPIPHIIFVPDPFLVHPIYVSRRAQLTMVSTDTAYAQAIHHGLAPNRVVITGHPVREEFYQSPKSKQHRRETLGLRPKLFTILFGGSGDGADKSMEVIKSLIQKLRRAPASRFQAIFITGTHTRLKTELERLSFPDAIEAHILGFVTNMHDYLHAADLVVGKAGPNMILEAVAACVPFCATYCLPQEVDNLKYLRDHQLGYVATQPQKATELLMDIIRQPDRLHTTFQSYLEKESRVHHRAAQNIAEQLKSFLKS